MQAAAAVALVDGVHGQHQRGLARRQQPGLQGQQALLQTHRAQVHEHHAGFGVSVSGLVEVAHQGAGRFAQDRAVVGRHGQGQAAVGAVLAVLAAKRAGADEDHELCGHAALAAQFFGGAAGKLVDRFDQLGQGVHRLAE